MNNPVKFGLLVGFLNVLFAYSIHFSGSTFLIDSTSVWYWLYGLLLPLVVMVVGGLLERKKLGGFVTYGHALKSTFIIYAIWSTLFFIAYNIIVLNVIDPNYMERNREFLVSKKGYFYRLGMEMRGADEDEIAVLVVAGTVYLMITMPEPPAAPTMLKSPPPPPPPPLLAVPAVA